MMKKMVVKKYEGGGPVTTTTKTTVKPKVKAKPKTASQKIGDLTLRDVKNAGENALNVLTLGGYKVGKKKIKELTGLKSGGSLKAKTGRTIKKAKSGTKMMKSGGTTKDNSSFAKLAPPYNKATFADKIAGAKKNAGEAKNGTKIKKAMNGYGGKAASMVPPKKRTMKMGGTVKKAMMGTMAAPMMKKGGTMKKCKYGCK